MNNCVGRNEYDAQLGYAELSNVPGQTKARNPTPATEGETQQQGVDQQREQQRISQSRAPRVQSTA